MLPFTKTLKRVSSRHQIQIKEVKDGILLLPNQEYRLLVETSSINFELKSEEEQDVLIDSFQNFLNSLPCHVQILVRVREVDINSYIEYISQTKEHELELIYKQQIASYCTFIRKLVAGNKILARHFYVVIPYHPQEKTYDFSLIKEQVRLYRDVVIRGLEKLGMKAKPLDSLEILNLFYTFYNPALAKTQELKGETIHALIEHDYV
jgi:hypothetical protein